MDKFYYLGSVVTGIRNVDEEVAHRIQAGWINESKISRMLFECRIRPKVEENIYKL